MFQFLNNHMWLLAIILDNADRGYFSSSRKVLLENIRIEAWQIYATRNTIQVHNLCNSISIYYILFILIGECRYLSESQNVPEILQLHGYEFMNYFISNIIWFKTKYFPDKYLLSEKIPKWTCISCVYKGFFGAHFSTLGGVANSNSLLHKE